MKTISTILILLLSCILSGHAWSKNTSGIVVTIKPLHSLVSGVLGETGKAELLLADNTSPHDFHLKPSQVTSLNKAKLVFYIDDSFETFLQDAFKALPETVRKAAVAQNSGLELRNFREGGAWDSHAHDHHGKDEHHDENHKDNGHKKEHKDKHHADEKHHDDHDEHDLHVWLDPKNAIRIVNFIARELSAAYPSNKAAYEKNAKDTIAKLEALDKELKTTLAELKDKPFIVFHDAYQYYERAYNLRGVGSITFEPDESPSASRISEVRKKLKETKAKCVFREPQFADRLVNTVIEGTDARKGVLDPLGADLENGETLYFALMRNLADNLKQCLK